MTDSRSQCENRWRWRIFATTWVAYAGFYLCRKNLAVAMPLLEAEFGYSSADLALVLFCDGLVYGLAQVAFGLLADRAGARRTVALGFAITITAVSLMSNATSIGAFAALAAVNGLGQAAGWPGLVKNVGAWFPRRSRGVVMGWWSTNYMLGGFAATAFTAWLATHAMFWPGLGWRRAFLIPSGVAAVIGIAYVLLARDRPADAGLPSEHPSLSQEVPLDMPALAGMVRDLDLWAVSLGSLFSKTVRYALMFWLPLYLVQQHRFAVREAGILSSVFELAGPAGSLLAGHLSDRVLGARRLPAAALLFAALAFACGFHPLLAATGRAGLLLSIALLGVFCHGPDSLLQGAAAQDLGTRWGAGLAAGFVSGFASLGQVTAPVLVAAVSARYGWDGVFFALMLASLAGAAILFGRRSSSL